MKAVAYYNNPKGRVIAWWSGGVTSAVACFWAVKRFDNVEIVMIDTKNEDADTYRFRSDCERWLYGCPVKSISSEKFQNIEQVWDKYSTLTTAHGALCSTELKRAVREAYQKPETDRMQVFGFEAKKKEYNRHLAMCLNYPEINCTSPLAAFGYNKPYCIKLLEGFGIQVPLSYYVGFENNNCLETLCVKGGIGYWQLAKKIYPEKVHIMAMREHKYTGINGKPTTICKDQSGDNDGYVPVFLEPHPDYPNVKDISMKKGRQPKGLMECIGFCNTIN